MKKKQFVIENTPVRLPILSTVVYTFILYYFKVDNVWWGIFITLYSIFWIIAIAVKLNEIRINLNDDSSKNKVAKSKFAMRIEELMKQHQGSK